MLALAACARSGPNPASSTAPAGPPNAPIAEANAIPLDDAQKSELRKTVEKSGSALRSRLRYALALADDGKRYLVVYDGGVAGKEAKGYTLPPVLNRADGSHYDPQQNELIAPIPPPKERDYTTEIAK